MASIQYPPDDDPDAAAADDDERSLCKCSDTDEIMEPWHSLRWQVVVVSVSE